MINFAKKIVAFSITSLMLLPALAYAVAPQAGSAEVSSTRIAQTETNTPKPGGDMMDNFKQVGTASALSTQDVRTTIGNVIKGFMAVLGIILVIIFIYAGYLWMMAGGNAEQVKKAKSLMINATIGLVIMMAAYAITEFVLKSIINATPSSNGGGGSGGSVSI